MINYTHYLQLSIQLKILIIEHRNLLYDYGNINFWAVKSMYSIILLITDHNLSFVL